MVDTGRYRSRIDSSSTKSSYFVLRYDRNRDISELIFFLRVPIPHDQHVGIVPPANTHLGNRPQTLPHHHIVTVCGFPRVIRDDGIQLSNRGRTSTTHHCQCLSEHNPAKRPHRGLKLGAGAYGRLGGINGSGEAVGRLGGINGFGEAVGRLGDINGFGEAVGRLGGVNGFGEAVGRLGGVNGFGEAVGGPGGINDCEAGGPGCGLDARLFVLCS
jgi:hypothetical protein